MKYCYKIIGSITIFILALFTTACASFSTYMSLALQFALNALQIYSLASGLAVSPATITALQNKEAAIVTLESAYVKGTSPLSDVQAAIADFQSNLSAAYVLANVKDPAVQSEIAAIVGLVNTNITLAETFFSSNASAPASSSVKKASAKVVTLGHLPKAPVSSISQMKKSYNAIVSRTTNSPNVDKYAQSTKY